MINSKASRKYLLDEHFINQESTDGKTKNKNHYISKQLRPAKNTTAAPMYIPVKRSDVCHFNMNKFWVDQNKGRRGRGGGGRRLTFNWNKDLLCKKNNSSRSRYFSTGLILPIRKKWRLRDQQSDTTKSYTKNTMINKNYLDASNACTLLATAC